MLSVYIKKPTLVVFCKLLINKFRTNKLIKDPLGDGLLLQLRLILYKDLVLSLTNITNVGSTIN